MPQSISQCTFMYSNRRLPGFGVSAWTYFVPSLFAPVRGLMVPGPTLPHLLDSGFRRSDDPGGQISELAGRAPPRPIPTPAGDKPPRYISLPHPTFGPLVGYSRHTNDELAGRRGLAAPHPGRFANRPYGDGGCWVGDERRR